MSAKLTADEALKATRECAYHDGAGVQSAGLAEDAEAAEAAIREAFTIATRAREELARVEAHIRDDHSEATAHRHDAELALLNRIIEEGS
jgi:hypothetical protein